MFRRSRFSVRPNVGTTGRTAVTSQEAPSSNQEATETPGDTSTSSTPTAVTDTTPAVTPAVTSTASGDGGDHIVEGSSSSAAVQRRKRFSVKPKVAPGRLSTIGRTPKSPIKSVSETPVEVPISDLDKQTTSSQTGTTAAPQGLQSPKRRRPSEESKQPKVQPKITLPPSDSAGPPTVPLPDEVLQKTNLTTDSGKQSESNSESQVKDVPPKPQDKVLFSIPDRETVEISEKAKTLVSSKSGRTLTPSTSLSKLLNDPSDLQRLAKAQKLRELLRQERHKDKKPRKSKTRVKEYTLDPSKMTMSDLIHYLPLSNPMTSSLEDMDQENENETVVPPSPGREESPESAKEPEVPPKVVNPSGEEEEEEVAEDEQDEQDDSLMVPQLKVAEDGSLIIDEESLTVEVLRAKGPNPAQERDPIFERGSTTTYTSFRTVTHTKPWSSEETDMFFLAISMVGTDFSMISQLFPHRARSEIKNKFKKEERLNSWRIDKAFRERRKLDIEYFSKLLEKILEFQKNKKKLQSLAKKNAPKKRKRKEKKATSKLSDVDEEEEDDEVPDLDDEEGGEKENEALCNEGKSPVSKPKRQRKRKTKQADSSEEPKERKRKKGEKSSDQAEACIPEDSEAALPEEHTSSDITEKTENENPSKDTTVKPARLSRGRAPKSLVPLGRKWGKKPPPDSGKDKDTTPDNGDHDVCDDGVSKEQVNKESSPLRQASKKQSADGDVSSEDEPASVQPPKPTRYGRMPKPIQPLNYPAKEAAHSSASDATPGSPVGSTASTTKPKPKCKAKRVRPSKQESAQVSKKPKLVTLRASRTEYSDDEDERQQGHAEIEEEEEEQFACSLIEDSSAPVFVPASLRSPRPVISQVEETMEELDILANIPDVLGISQDALCPGVSWEQAQNETDTPEPCEHQLDLLVDVIDFLSSEHKEVCEDESYNEAAQTLLAIGNPTHLPQTAQTQLATQDHITEILSVSAKQPGQHMEEAAFQEASNDTLLMFGHEDTETSETIFTVEQQHALTDSSCIPIIKTSDQTCDEPKTDPSLQCETESSKQNYPQTRKGHLSKVKPKPNLDRSSKTVQPKSQPDTPAEQTAEESNSEAANHHQVTETLSIPEETIPNIPEFSDISCTKVKLEEKLSFCQEGSSAATSDQSISENQSHCLLTTVNTDTQSTSESSNEKVTSPAEIIAPLSNNLVTSDISVTETQVEQGSNTDSVPLKESCQHTAAFVTPAEHLTVSQKEVTSQSRCSRLQKVKPKPNIPRTSRTARLTPSIENTKDSAENDSTLIFPNFKEKAMVELELEEKCGTSPEKPCHATGPATALASPFDPESTLSPTMELSTTEEKKTDGGLVSQLHFSTISGQSGSENQCLSDVSFKPSSRDTGSTSAAIDEKGATQDQPAENSDDLVTSLSDVTVSQAGQESREHPATHVDDLPVLQKAESEVKTSCQSRRNRLQKVKPKIPQTPRTPRSTPQITKDSVEKDCNPTPVLKAVESSCDSALTLSTTQESPTSEKEKRTDDGHIGQVFSVASTSGQSVSENKIFSDVSFESINKDTGSTSAATDQKWLTQNEMTENTDISVTSDSAATESQAGQDLAAVTESSEDPATHVTPVEDISVSQKEVSDVTSMSQSRSSRFQKVKPKPNIPQTSRTALLKSRTKDKKGSAEKDSNPTPILKLQEKAIVEIGAEGDCGTSPEKPSHSVGPATALMSSFDPESTLSPTKESFTTEEEKRTDDGLVGQLHFAATSGQSGSENQSLSNVPFKPSSRDTGSTSAAIDEKGETQDQPAESNDDLVTSLSAVTVSQAGQESREHPATHVTPVDDLPVLQKAESEVKTSCQSRRNRLQKVKPKPNIPQTPRTPRSTPQTTKDCVEKDYNPTPVLKAVESSCDSASTLSTTQELLTSEKEKSTDDGHIGQVFSVASASGQSVSENKIFSDVSFEPINKDTGSTSAATDQKWLTQNEMTENTDISVTSDSAATESQAGQDLAAVTESSEDPATHVTPEDGSVEQKEVSDVTSVSQSRSSRFQRVKPKPNIPQTSRTALLKSRTKDKKGSAEKDSNPTPILKLQEKAMVVIKPEGDCGTSPEKPSHSVGPTIALMSSFDPESTLSPTKEPFTTAEDKKTDDGLVGQLDFAATISGQSGSENQSLSDVSFKPSSRDTGSTSVTIDEKGATQGQPAKSSDDLVTSLSDVTVSQAGQESREHPATHVDDLPVLQKAESEVKTSCQSRRNRLQKVKPKIPQTPRTPRSTPQTTKDCVEKDCNPTPVMKAVESSCDSASTLSTTQELPTSEKEKRTDDGHIGQVFSVASTSGQSVSENKIFSDVSFEPINKDTGSTSAATDQKWLTQNEMTENTDISVTSDSAATESQAGQDLAAVTESSEDPATHVTPEDGSVSQKEQNEVTSTCQPRRSRSQKVKPKPHIPQRSRTALLIPQTTKDSDTTPTSKLHKKTEVQIEPPSVLITSSEDCGSSPATTKEMSTTEKGERTDDELVGQAKTVGATSGQFGSENQNLVTPDSAPTETQTGQDVAPLQKSSDDHLTCVTPVSQKQGGEITAISQPRRGQFLKVKPKPNLVQSSRTVESKPQVMPVQLEERPSSPTSKTGSTDNAAAEVEALPICSVNLPVKPRESTNTSSVSVPSLEICTTQNTTEELSATMKQKTELALTSSSDSSETKAPQRRRHLPKVKPNVGSSTRPTWTKPETKSISSSNVTLEKQPVENSQAELNPTDNNVHLTSSHCTLNTELGSTQSALDESEKRLASTHDESMSAHVISMATSGETENQSLLSNTQPVDYSTAASGDGHTVSRTDLLLAPSVTSIPDTRESSPHSCVQSDADVRSRDETQLSSETSNTEQTSNDKFQSAQSTDPTHSALSDSSKSSKEAMQTRRGRLIKPKPKLGRGSRPLQPQVQNSTQAEADSEDRDASVSHDPVSKLQPDNPEPVEGAIETHSKPECPPSNTESLLGCLTQIIDQPSPNDAASPLGCLTQVLDTSSQNTPILTTEGETQSHPCLTLFPHMTSEQVPSDKDEPFFILSLTEIPVGSSGELVETAAEPLPLVGETSIQQQSLSGESLAPAGEEPIIHDPVSPSTEEMCDVGFFSVKDAWSDPADSTDLIIENQVDPLENTTVQPSKLQETVDDNKTTGSPPTKQRLTGTGRRAKLQVKPHTMRKTRASKSENTNKDSELPGPSMQPEGSAGSDLLSEPQKRSNEPENTEKETPAGAKGPEDGHHTGAKTQTPKAATRKGNSNTASSNPSSGKAASKDSKVKTPQTRRKYSQPSPAASASLHVAPTAASSQQPEEIPSASTTSAALEVDVIQRSTDHSQLRSDPIPSTSCTEVSAPQQSPESESEEEPTNVSQYFLSDIFTEVEDD
ncbi:transcription factor TFIIIB component B'' homolog isoform X2 [Solea solea]|uniref:transcription factor TFIIIB component B'' homolog isoform X2 n=1 Tax=Solea solea TaxID=90069 RepID=UPI00272A9C39|nr:transcription factor TFIIIB component B'' homolog isoform X2 [Solea solea]